MKAAHFALLTLGMVVAFVLGVQTARPDPLSEPTSQEIAEAQQIGDRLLPRMWSGMFQNQAWLKALRRRGYIYCYQNRTISPDCARAQDEAIQNVFFALTISKAQQSMANQSELSPREFEVARNPELRSTVIRYCSRLYADHGQQDVRVLAACLGNLSDFSPLVAVPVP
ncbi:hypothetical protein FHS94_000988 [Sphingomonas aerophila]|uniref:Uncharacterized protein n=1 Tax=Sphingomonas aerophila TaxID=1344948 RepID=A0A7W9BBH1_9SPHN|nr:hypothetical protein [Sphingomonas aerophila]